MQLKQGNVGRPVIAEDSCLVAVARLRDDDLDGGRAADHVVVRQHLARRCQHHPRPGSRTALVGEIRVDDDNAAPDGRRRPARESDSRPHRRDEESDQHEQDNPPRKLTNDLHAVSGTRSC